MSGRIRVRSRGNGLDDDGNGYIVDATVMTSQTATTPDGLFGHGTHVAGTVGAVGDNGVGVVGVNWDVSLMGLKIGSDLGGPVTSAAIEALNYAVAKGAVVSNHSYGIAPTQAFEDAIINARIFNHIVVAAAGNSGLITMHFLHSPPAIRRITSSLLLQRTQTDQWPVFRISV